MSVMFKWYAQRQIQAFENEFDYDMSYAREILSVGVKALSAFMKATALTNFRGPLPNDVWHVARVVAFKAFDCGPCLQLSVTMAERAGIDAQVLSALLAGRYTTLPKPLERVARFTEAAIRRHESAEELREQIRQAYGSAGLVALSFAIAGSSLYPSVKYTLGYGKSCVRTRVGEQWISPAGAPATPWA